LHRDSWYLGGKSYRAEVVGFNPTRSISSILGNYGSNYGIKLSFFLASPNRLITGVLLPHIASKEIVDTEITMSASAVLIMMTANITAAFGATAKITMELLLSRRVLEKEELGK
jgi:hypothetical protein